MSAAAAKFLSYTIENWATRNKAHNEIKYALGLWKDDDKICPNAEERRGLVCCIKERHDISTFFNMENPTADWGKS